MGTKSAAMTRIVVAIVLVALFGFAGFGIYKLAQPSSPPPNRPADENDDARGREPSAEDIARKKAEKQKEEEEEKKKKDREEARKAEAANARAAIQRAAEEKKKEEAAQQKEAAAAKKAADEQKKKEEEEKKKAEAEAAAKKAAEEKKKKKEEAEAAAKKAAEDKKKREEAAKKKKPSPPPPKGTVPQTRADYENTLVAKYKVDMASIRKRFSSRYKASDFSNDFLSDDNLSALLQHLSGVELGDIDLAESIISFVVGYDEGTGYPKSKEKRHEALKIAREQFKRRIARTADDEAWERRMKVVNEGMQHHCTEMTRKRESYVQPEDMTRAEGADRIHSRMSAAMRCRAFNSPKEFTDSTVSRKKQKAPADIDWNALMKVCDCSFGTNMKEIPGKCVVPQPKAARGYLAGTPVFYYNVRDIDKERPMPVGGF